MNVFIIRLRQLKTFKKYSLTKNISNYKNYSLRDILIENIN